MAATLFYMLRVEAKKVAVEVRINDVPLFAHDGSSDLSMSAQVNHLIIKGANDVRLAIRPADDAEAPPADASVCLTLREAKKGQTVDEARELIQRVWRASSHATEAQERGEDPANYPIIRIDSTTISAATGEWRWQTASRVVLSPAVAQALKQRVSKIHAALAIRNDHDLLPMMGLRHEEMSQAFGRPREELDQGFRKTLRDAFRDRQWSMAPFDADSLRLEVVGGGRIVWVREGDGNQALRSNPLSNGGELRQQLMFSRVDGEWVIVR